jgi:hypothetical protein
VFVPERRRKSPEIHVARLDDVLEDRSARDDLWLEARRRHFPLHRLAAQRVDKARRVQRGIEAERERHAPRVAESAGQDAVAPRVADDVVEQQRRRRFAPIVDFGDGADFEVPVRAADVLQLTEALDLLDPRAEIRRQRTVHV